MNLMTAEQARLRLNLGRTTIYTLLSNGSLKAIRIGRAIRISDFEIERFIRQGGAPNTSDCPEGALDGKEVALRNG
jgi:excisionase family DNA binding protein